MNDTERARSLADRYWEDLLVLEPMLGTMIGDERYDDRLSDPSEEGRERSRVVNQAALDELASIDRTALDITMRGTLDVMEAIARRAIAELAHGTDRLRAAAHFFGPAQTLAEVASMQAADTPERVDRYEARLRAVPRVHGRVGRHRARRHRVRRDVAATGDGARGGAARAPAGARTRGVARPIAPVAGDAATRRNGSRTSFATW